MKLLQLSYCIRPWTVFNQCQKATFFAHFCGMLRLVAASLQASVVFRNLITVLFYIRRLRTQILFILQSFKWVLGVLTGSQIS